MYVRALSSKISCETETMHRKGTAGSSSQGDPGNAMPSTLQLWIRKALQSLHTMMLHRAPLAGALTKHPRISIAFICCFCFRICCCCCCCSAAARSTSRTHYDMRLLEQTSSKTHTSSTEARVEGAKITLAHQGTPPAKTHPVLPVRPDRARYPGCRVSSSFGAEQEETGSRHWYRPLLPHFWRTLPTALSPKTPACPQQRRPAPSAQPFLSFDASWSKHDLEMGKSCACCVLYRCGCSTFLHNFFFHARFQRDVDGVLLWGHYEVDDFGAEGSEHVCVGARAQSAADAVRRED